MSNAPTRYPHPYPSFDDPPPRAVSSDALLGKVIRWLVLDAARGDEILIGTLRAVLVALDHRSAAGATRPAGEAAATAETPCP